MGFHSFKFGLLFAFLLVHFFVCGQDKLFNRRYFKTFFRATTEKSLLVLGENHAAGVGSAIYPDLVTYLNKKNGLRTLLVEFGPAEAYFYNRYLKTGDEKHLNYTLYAGGDEKWRNAWRKLYAYNRKLAKPLVVIGIDFDRTRTFAYALYSIFAKYHQRPGFVQTLMDEIRTDAFYNTYTIGYPTAQDKRWVHDVKSLLKEKYWELQLLLNAQDLATVTGMLRNNGTGYDGGREAFLAETTQRVIADSDERKFFLLIGRSHAYLNPVYGDKKSLVARLVDSSGIAVRTGAILFQDTELWGGKDRKEKITLFEIKNKTPWKPYFSVLDKKQKQSLRIIPLADELRALAYYADFILLARGRKL